MARGPMNQTCGSRFRCKAKARARLSSMRLLPSCQVATKACLCACRARSIKSSEQAGGPNYPIKQLFGPGIDKAFGNEVVQRNLKRLVREKFPVIFKNEARFYLSKLK